MKDKKISSQSWNHVTSSQSIVDKLHDITKGNLLLLFRARWVLLPVCIWSVLIYNYEHDSQKEQQLDIFNKLRQNIENKQV